MQLEHSFTVPVGIEDAWRVLLDIELIAPCMPGAAIDSVDGDNFTGTVKVKLGPIGLTYKGKASFVEKDPLAHRAVIDARGRDARGNGTANAKVTATLTDSGSSTKVHVVTDLDVTGKPAQFGRGVMEEVGNKLIGQFADCLAGKFTDGASAPAEPAAQPAPRPRPRPRKATGAESVAPSAPVAAVAPTAKAAPAASAPAPAGAHASAAEAPVEPAAAPAPTSAAAPPKHATPEPRRTAADVEPINLLESAGPALAKRLVPIIVVVIVVLVALRRRRR